MPTASSAGASAKSALPQKAGNWRPSSGSICGRYARCGPREGPEVPCHNRRHNDLSMAVLLVLERRQATGRERTVGCGGELRWSHTRVVVGAGIKGGERIYQYH